MMTITFSEIISLMDNWQNLIGSFLGALVAIAGSLVVTLIIRHFDTIKEKRRQYTVLLLVLYDLQLFISRCEMYLKFKSKQIVSFDIITPNRHNYVDAINAFNLETEVCNNIQQLYNVASIISHNMEKGELLETHFTKNGPNKRSYTQTSILGNRYNVALGFVEHYLIDVYKRFNDIALAVKNLAKKDPRYKFPASIQIYLKNYVEEKIAKYNLVNGKISKIDPDWIK